MQLLNRISVLSGYKCKWTGCPFPALFLISFYLGPEMPGHRYRPNQNPLWSSWEGGTEQTNDQSHLLLHIRWPLVQVFITKGLKRTHFNSAGLIGRQIFLLTWWQWYTGITMQSWLISGFKWRKARPQPMVLKYGCTSTMMLKVAEASRMLSHKQNLKVMIIFSINSKYVLSTCQITVLYWRILKMRTE